LYLEMDHFPIQPPDIHQQRASENLTNKSNTNTNTTNDSSVDSSRKSWTIS
jgi:hypothetical protein